MKNILKLLALGLMFLGVFFFAACEEETEDVHPLVGTWEMSNMEQTSTYVLAADIPGVMPAGTPLGSGTKKWSFFHDTLSVHATVVLKKDNTFTLSGSLPVANDTLGFAPSVVPLTDNGTWTAAEDLSTLLIDGGLYDLGGVLTMDDADDPTDIAMAYSEVDTIDAVIPVTGVGYFRGSVQETSSTLLGFTKQ